MKLRYEDEVRDLIKSIGLHATVAKPGTDHAVLSGEALRLCSHAQTMISGMHEAAEHTLKLGIIVKVLHNLDPKLADRVIETMELIFKLNPFWAVAEEEKKEKTA